MSYAPIQTRWQSADLALQKGDESTAAGPRKPGGEGSGALVAGAQLRQPGGAEAGMRGAAWSGVRREGCRLVGARPARRGWPCGGCGAAAPAELAACQSEGVR